MKDIICIRSRLNYLISLFLKIHYSITIEKSKSEISHQNKSTRITDITHFRQPTLSWSTRVCVDLVFPFIRSDSPTKPSPIIFVPSEAWSNYRSSERGQLSRTDPPNNEPREEYQEKKAQCVNLMSSSQVMSLTLHQQKIISIVIQETVSDQLSLLSSAR
ncbi:hypothetical protein CEXT_246571 [Caerostris extrusa]|uniref:Uncharacterized protein n=1 Tax=Caerostris extrusa TaxID=172846 RepID=A0AAV4URE2_CAEEX|nr:hypothetical protein CEXT_246571 [Caerostris extrusa]